MATEANPPAQENADSSSEHLEIEGVTEGGWVQWFCSLEGNDFFVEVDEEFIKDQSNLYGLRHRFEPTRFKYFFIMNIGKGLY